MIVKSACLAVMSMCHVYFVRKVLTHQDTTLMNSCFVNNQICFANVNEPVVGFAVMKSFQFVNDF